MTAQRLNNLIPETERTEFQEEVNRAAAQLRLPLIVEDGVLGRETAASLERVAWLLGLYEEKELDLTDVGEARRWIADWDSRSEEQRECARQRQRTLGPEITGSDLARAASLLRLVGDWESWISRRVEVLSFPSDIPRTVVRAKTIEFRLPAEVITAQDADPDQRTDFATPLTFAKKWHQPRFDIRDEAGRLLQLPSRDELGALCAAMLVTRATQVVTGKGPLLAEEFVPDALADDLREIVNGNPDVALAVCDRIYGHVEGEPDEQAHSDVERRDPATMEEPVARISPGSTEARREHHWRRKLAADQIFIELAYEFANGFLVTPLCAPPLTVQRGITLTWPESWEEPPPQRVGPWLRSVVRRVRRAISTESDWPWRHSDVRTEMGALTISSRTYLSVVGARPASDPSVCAALTITAPSGRTKTVDLKASGVHDLYNMPIGEYRFQVEAKPGFKITGLTESVTVEPGETGRAEVRARQAALDTEEPSPAVPTPRLALGRRFSRWTGLRSQFGVLAGRIGDGGSTHVEVEAPPGFSITRARLVDTRRGLRDILLQTTQRAHLYIPARESESANSYTVLNFRPRRDTVLRPAIITSTLASLALLAIAVRWVRTDSPGSGAQALVLAVPAALSAYFAQAVPDNVRGTLATGVRAMVLAPGFYVFLAAGLVVLGPHFSWSLTALWIDFGLCLGSAFGLGIVYRLALNPPEQRPHGDDQSRSFAKVYPYPDRS